MSNDHCETQGEGAEALNRPCFCLTLDRQALCAALELEADDPFFCRTYVTPRSNLLSNVPVFLFAPVFAV